MSLSPTNGKLLWKKKLDKPLGARGFTYHESKDADIRGIYIASGKKIIQLHNDASYVFKFFVRNFVDS